MQMAHGVGEDRHRTQLVKQADVDALVAQHERGSLGELRAHAAGVIRDDDAALGVFGILAVDVVGKALGRPADIVEVHAVGARAEHAAHAGGAEGQLGIEAVLNLLLVALKRLELLDGRGVVREVAQPGFVLLTIGHGDQSSVTFFRISTHAAVEHADMHKPKSIIMQIERF